MSGQDSAGLDRAPTGDWSNNHRQIDADMCGCQFAGPDLSADHATNCLIMRADGKMTSYTAEEEAHD